MQASQDPKKRPASPWKALIEGVRGIPGMRRLAHACLRRVHESRGFQKHVVQRLVGDATAWQVGLGDSWVGAGKAVRAELKRIAQGTGPVVVGPWLSEVGFEVLYWIPFLHWAVESSGIDPGRLVVVSRGGTAAWYEAIAARYLDLLDHFSPDDFRARNEGRVRDAGGQKHRSVGRFDEEILERVAEVLGVERGGLDLIHPSLMYNLFVPFWRGKAPISLLRGHTHLRPYAAVDSGKDGLDLPAEFVAVKFYFSNCFPDTEANRRFVSRFIAVLSAKSPVVLLSTGLRIDDHSDWSAGAASGGRIIHLEGRLDPSRNLAVQTEAVRRARVFVGTYGGFSYLAPFHGVSSVAVYSEPKHFLPVHLEVAFDAFRRDGFGGFSAANARDIERTGILEGVKE